MFTALAVADIEPNPGQPRKHFDEGALNELAGSIAANGLLEPVVVRPSMTVNRFILIAGERRWRASKIAGLESIPARIMDLSEEDAYVLSVAENVNRADMTIMEEADAYAQLRLYGKSVQEIGLMFGKAAGDITMRLSLIDLEPEARKMVEAGLVGPTFGWHLAKLRPGDQRVVINKWARGEFALERDAQAFAEALHDAAQQDGFFELVEPTLEERREHSKRAKKAKAVGDQINRLSALLHELAAESPADLAAALGNDVNARLSEIEDIVKVAGKARTTMRRAKGFAAARSVAISEDLMAKTS